MAVELYGTRSCPHTAEARADLEWRGVAFSEFDVEQDVTARKRMIEMTGGQRTVPVIVEDGRVTQIGWQGRGCVVGA